MKRQGVGAILCTNADFFYQVSTTTFASTERKNRVLQAFAIALRDRSGEILEANALDLEEAKKNAP